MKAITQEHEFGCGIASIAFVLGITYKDTSKLFSIKKADLKGFYCKDLIKVLKYSGLDYTYRYLKPRFRRKIYRNGSIVFIKRSRDYPHGHYLVRGKGCWMDSWINFKEDINMNNAISGFRKRLPGKPIYILERLR